MMNEYPLYRQIFGWMHIVAGVSALLVAPVAMMVHKGGKSHRTWGKVYFWSMFAIFISALGMLYYRVNPFLLMITTFSFYMALTGYRVIYRKRPEKGHGANLLDWGAALLAGLAGAGFIIWGVASMAGIFNVVFGSQAFSILGIVFGILLLSSVHEDVRVFRQPIADRNWWWYYHMNRILSSYIAAVSAFTVQQIAPRFALEIYWVFWVAPGVMGGFGIGYWVAHYRRKFEHRRAVRERVRTERSVPSPFTP